MAVITGNNQKNKLNGTGGSDIISGLGGNDTLFGKSGDDVLKGGSGNDRVDGGAGDDILKGDAGKDLLIGGAGSDVLRGGAGNDVLRGGDAADILNGGAGKDTADFSDLKAGVGVVFDAAGGGFQFDITNNRFGAADVLVGIENIKGSKFADVIAGSDENAIANRFDGGGGDDNILGGGGADTLIGGAGNDLLQGDAGADKLIGGAGIDTAVYQTEDDLFLNLADSSQNTGAVAVGDTYNGIEALRAGNGDDTLIGDAGNNILDGDTGRDRLFGAAGNDIFKFSRAGDTGVGSANADLISDFTQGQDKIDISQIKGPEFVFLGTDTTFAGFEQEILFVKTFDVIGVINLPVTLIQGNINGDLDADFTIKLTGHVDLTANDFIL